MTTEMGESLCYSWLKHIKECQVVQTNWKSSFNWIHEELKLDILQEAEKWFEGKYNFAKEKNNLYRTTECDVLGVQCKSSTYKVFAVEVAFHRGNLNYKHNNEKVISKCLRIAICLRACFSDHQIEVYFASPKVSDKNIKILKKAFETMNEKYSAIDDKIHFSLLVNDDFKNKILKPVLIKNKQIADTSELFVRSCQLLEAAGLKLDTTLTEDFLSDIESVSEIAWNYMVPLLEKMKSNEITELTQKGNLGISGWPVLSQNRDGMQKRYYAPSIMIDNKEYYLTNHWTNQNKRALIQWIIDHSK